MMIKDVIAYNLIHFLSVIFSIVYYFTFVIGVNFGFFNKTGNNFFAFFSFAHRVNLVSVVRRKCCLDLIPLPC